MNATTGTLHPRRSFWVDTGRLCTAAVTLLSLLGLGGCWVNIDDPSEALEGLNASGGVGGTDLASPPGLESIEMGVAGAGGALAGAAGTPPLPQYAPGQWVETEDLVVDLDPLACTAPDRAEYKARHGIVVEDDADGGVAADESDGGVEPYGSQDLDAGVAGDDPVDSGVEVDSGDPLDSFSLDSEGMEHTVLFVFDKSGSMAFPWDGQRNKWKVAADTMIEAVTPYQSYLSVGAIFFPTDRGCEVASLQSGAQIDFLPGGDYLAAWEASLQRYGPDGSTPMSVAFIRADQAIARACAQGVLERPFKVVVLTDGEPNCDGDMRLLTEYPAKWARHGIKTYVVGLPGSDVASGLLQSIAAAGQTDTFLAERGESDDAYFAPDAPEQFGEYMQIVLE